MRMPLVGDALTNPYPPGAFIYPAIYKPGSRTRCAKNIVGSPFMVITSPTLPLSGFMDAIEWLKGYTTLRAITYTNGRLFPNYEVEAWFEAPNAATMRQVEPILLRRGCSAQALRGRRFCWLPGVRVNGNFTAVKFLDERRSASTATVTAATALEVYHG
jgi:hypothetical protein